MTTFGILVGGGPAPGINGVIGAAAIRARRAGARVLGIDEGFRWLAQGDISRVRELEIADVSRIHALGGSVLHTSRADPAETPAHLARVVDALAALEVDCLISIGGDGTCWSARNVAAATRGRVRLVHVPKTIDNDLPLPPGVPTFGFETARAEAARSISHLMEDARTSQRWYVVVVMGRSAGHLALGAATAAGATVALVAEELGDQPVPLEHVQRIIEGSILKRRVMGRSHGVAVVAEGVAACIVEGDLGEIPLDRHGRSWLSGIPLGRMLCRRLEAGLQELGHSVSCVWKDLGYELRCAAPNAFDIEYTRELGAGAVRLLLEGASDVMITRQQGQIVPIPLSEVQDPATGTTRVRMLDVEGDAFAAARELYVRLEAGDLADGPMFDALQQASGLGPQALRRRYHHLRTPR
jgi:6-phosphofructokinase